VLLWVGLAVYTADLIRQDRRWRSSGARP
jgi:hypothetical protein